MSRYPDPPDVQAAKGHPGKRRSKVEKQLDEAARLAKDMASAPSSGPDVLSPPAYLDNPAFAAALAVWNELAPRLSRMNMLQPMDRYSFAMLCVYIAEWVEATQDIAKQGYVKNVKTVSGDSMPRRNPNVHRRDVADKMILELSARYGVTASDRAKLLRQQSVLPAGLFDQRQGVQRANADDDDAAETPAPKPAPAQDVIGAMDGFDSLPPDGLPN